jgi:hypothetical protein
MMDSFRGRRSMHTLRKLPTARPRMAKMIIKIISTGVYCGHIIGLKSIVRWYCCRQCLLCHCEPRFIGAKQYWWKIKLPLFYELPAQEGIGHVVNDIPDVGGVSLVPSDCDYVPPCP